MSIQCKERGMKRFRLHITCPAGHTTYQDYTRKCNALKALSRMSDTTGWYATHIEVVYTSRPTNATTVAEHTHICGDPSDPCDMDCMEHATKKRSKKQNALRTARPTVTGPKRNQ